MFVDGFSASMDLGISLAANVFSYTYTILILLQRGMQYNVNFSATCLTV